MRTFTNKAEAISYMRQLECHLAELAGYRIGRTHVPTA